MFGSRGKIGYVNPAAVYWWSREFDQILPEGIDVFVTSLGTESLDHQTYERVFPLYPAAAEKLARHEVDFIFIAGGPAFMHMGLEKAEEMAGRIEETTGIPTMLNTTAIINALHKLSAKKIVAATPHEAELNEVYPKKLLQQAGFEVLNVKGLGLRRLIDAAKVPPHESYRLAKEAFLEAPEADAIYIPCPAWEVVQNIDPLERDLGKPVVAGVQLYVWAALTAMHIKGPIKGYGRLLEML